MLLYFLFLVHLLPVAASDVDNVKEMGFKLWLIPGVQECYHEVLEKSSRIYFMYEILNAQSDDDRIVVFFRDAHNRNILSLSRTPRRGHLDLLINDTMLLDICMDHDDTHRSAKYLAVFFHIYHVDKMLAKLHDIEQFDHLSSNARNSLKAIADHVIVSREYQMQMEMSHQTDLYRAEENVSWLNRWALVHIFIIVVCCALQTCFVRRLFMTTKR